MRVLIDIGREDLLEVIHLLQDPELDEGHSQLADNLLEQLDRYCPEAENHQHVMFKPNDSEHIQWGEFGVCSNCQCIRKLD